MSRSTQFIGLNERATKFVKDNGTYVKTKCGCPDCKGDHNVLVHEVHDKTYGMFDEEIPLSKFTLTDGREALEYVQWTEHSSGSCIFTALKDKDSQPIEETLWSKEEISRNC